MLYRNSKYIKVSLENVKSKRDLVQGISGAIYMYIACLIISGYFWYTISNEKKYRDDDLRLLD